MLLHRLMLAKKLRKKDGTLDQTDFINGRVQKAKRWLRDTRPNELI